MLTPAAGCAPFSQPGAWVAQLYEGTTYSGICVPALPVKRYQPVLSPLSQMMVLSPDATLRFESLSVEYAEHSEGMLE